MHQERTIAWPSRTAWSEAPSGADARGSRTVDKSKNRRELASGRCSSSFGSKVDRGGALGVSSGLGWRSKDLTRRPGRGIPEPDKSKNRRELAMAWCPQFLSVRSWMDCSHLLPRARTGWVTERIAWR